MTDDKMLNITIDQIDDLTTFIKTAIITPMERNITGSITIHIVEGTIKAYEANIRSRTSMQIKNIYNSTKRR